MKTRRLNRIFVGKGIVILLATLFQCQTFLAKDDVNTLVFPSGWFYQDGEAYREINQSVYAPAVIDTFGVYLASKPKVKQVVTTLSLLINPEVMQTSAYRAVLTGYYKATMLSGAKDSVAFTLEINYDPLSATNYKQRDALSIPGCVHAIVVAKIQLDGIAIGDANDEAFRVEFNNTCDAIYTPKPSEIPVFNPIQEDAKAEHIRWTWTNILWAEYYELEYIYVDDYAASGGRRNRSELPYDFRSEAVRLRVKTNQYTLPLVFEQGYLITRVRAVGYTGTDFLIPVYGDWSSATKGFLSESGNHIFDITPERCHEADRLNWQYSSGFNEEGFRSEQVIYVDGTHRARQRVLASHEISKVIVSESFYDSYGREVIQTLPAPTVPGASALNDEPVAGTNIPGEYTLDNGMYTLNPGLLAPQGNLVNAAGLGSLPLITDGPVLWDSPFNSVLEENIDWERFRDLFSFRTSRSRLGYVPSFNRNADGGNLLRSNYDVGDKCDYSPLPLSDESGAALYYSEQNPEKLRWQAYLPDAQGFPYTRTTYFNDGSGRIKSVRTPGEIYHTEASRSQQYFYGTPSQDELFRFFGNDAGDASFYKSTLIKDANGQSHLSIMDLRGNVVLSALAGTSPENAMAIPNIPVLRDTVNVIAENNVLDESSNAWVSSKRLILTTNTELTLHYELRSPDFSGAFCDGNAFCLDCIYDIAISIIDDCGNVVFSFDEQLGNLDNLLQCESNSIRPETTLSLSTGSYIISKVLKVNEAATETYVQEYMNRFECRKSLDWFLPDIDDVCNESCGTCNVLTLEKPFTRLTGGTVTLPVTKRAEGNFSDCRLVCNDIDMSDIDKAYLAMLSEVSPGGQYAEYRDTTRVEDRPIGIVNPAIFPVSVLNEFNRLPLAAANWRNPAFDYQTKTGEKALVRISELGIPRHRAPLSEVVLRGGDSYVPVKYVEQVSDFVRLWEPQWAEALVVYHPEYEYYLWNKRQKNSFRFDSLLMAVDTFSVATSLRITDYNSDPILTSVPAVRASLESSLANFSTFDGAPLSISQMAIISVNCGNPNFDEDEMSECFRSRELFGTPGLEDKEWRVYKALYRIVKSRIVCKERVRSIIAAGGFDNRSIGGSTYAAANPNYAGKNRLFRDEENLYRELEFDLSGETPSYSEVMELANRVLAKRFAECGICPVGYDFLNFLNALAQEDKISSSGHLINGTSPILLSKAMVESFAIPDADEYVWSRMPDSDPNVLRGQITSNGTGVATITLRKTNPEISWDNLAWMDCLSPQTDMRFNLRIVDNQYRSESIQGETNVFNLTSCSFPTSCEPTPLRDEMLNFLQYMFQYNRYRSISSQVHSYISHSIHFGLNMRAAHTDGKTWVWKFAGFSSPQNKAFSANLSISQRNTAVMNVPTNCQFLFEIETPGFSFDSLSYVVSIQRKESPVPGYDSDKQAVISARSHGGRLFTIRMINTCYDLFHCETQNPNAIGSSGVCCLRLPVYGKVNTSCEDAMRLIAIREQERDLEARRQAAADSVRQAYIDHCLRNAGEIMEVSYDNSVYMVTLQYYDLSGALVKTVPPQGIVMLNENEIENCYRHVNNTSLPAVRPSHRMVSSYKYTSYGSIASKNTPDGGTDDFMYDFAGRIIQTRTSEQRANSKACYILYDTSNRMIESGQCNYSSVWNTFKDYSGFSAGVTVKSDLTIHSYSTADSRYAASFPGGQKYTRNRKSSIRTQSSPGSDEYVAAFSYDASGNITRMIQHYSLFALPDLQSIKTSDFSFDCLSGQLKQIIYQKDKSDQFIHWIAYDSNKRVRTVRTSTSLLLPEYLRDEDVRYNYYEHGPVARVELGEEKVQGIDYAYTLQGWEKAVNGFSAGNSEFDMGRDGSPDGDRFAASFPKDVFGEVTNYYDGDYERISPEAPSFLPMELPAAASTDFSKPLYNGHIQNIMQCVSQSFEDDSRKGFVQSYSYDQSGRLLETKHLFTSGISIENAYSDAYRMKLTYDLSGNIQSLQRANKDGVLFDNMTYNYSSPGANNRIDYIQDSGTELVDDFRSQSVGNYTYDASGRITSDRQGNIRSIRYTSDGKPSELDINGEIIYYKYDAFGRRIAKITPGQKEWYVNDNLGNTMAIYQINGSEIRWMEATIYGGKRVGMYRPEMLMSGRSIVRDTLTRGLKYYELCNRLGDVIAVVSDRKLPGVGAWRADVRKACNYFPYGFVMPGRLFSSDDYRYGYQGMMLENAMHGGGSAYSTEFRLYDSRIARWLSIDPMAEKLPRWSPYTAFDDNPISLVDPKGAQTRPDPHDPAVQIAALGELLDGAGNAVLWLITDAPGLPAEIAGQTCQNLYTLITGDYSTEGREEYDPRNMAADALIAIFQHVPWSDVETITRDERVRLRRIIRGGIVPAIIEENLRRAYPDASDEAITGMTGVIVQLGGGVVGGVATGVGITPIPTGIDDAFSGAVESGVSAAPGVIAPHAPTLRRIAETVRPSAESISESIAGSAVESSASPPASGTEGSTGTRSGARPSSSSRRSREARETRRRERDRAETERVPRRDRAARSGTSRRPRE